MYLLHWMFTGVECIHSTAVVVECNIQWYSISQPLNVYIQRMKGVECVHSMAESLNVTFHGQNRWMFTERNDFLWRIVCGCVHSMTWSLNVNIQRWMFAFTNRSECLVKEKTNKRKFPRNSLSHDGQPLNQVEKCDQKLLQGHEVPDTEVALRSAVAEESVGSGQVFILCGCKRDCSKGNCKCRRKGVSCTSRCHNGLPCPK